MRKNKTVEAITAKWDRQLWGFYDLFVTKGHKEIRAIKCFACGYVYKGELQPIPAGTSPCGFSYKCPNCYATFDAAMAKKVQPNESSFWIELDLREKQRLDNLAEIERLRKYRLEHPEPDYPDDWD